MAYLILGLDLNDSLRSISSYVSRPQLHSTFKRIAEKRGLKKTSNTNIEDSFLVEETAEVIVSAQSVTDMHEVLHCVSIAPRKAPMVVTPPKKTTRRTCLELIIDSYEALVGINHFESRGVVNAWIKEKKTPAWLPLEECESEVFFDYKGSLISEYIDQRTNTVHIFIELIDGRTPLLQS